MSEGLAVEFRVHAAMQENSGPELNPRVVAEIVLLRTWYWYMV